MDDIRSDRFIPGRTQRLYDIPAAATRIPDAPDELLARQKCFCRCHRLYVPVKLVTLPDVGFLLYAFGVLACV